MSAERPHVRALLFDVFGTLVDWRSSVTAQLAALGRERSVTCDWAAVADAWRAEYGPSMNEVRRGERPWANLDTLHAESFERVAGRFGLDGLTAADRRRAVRFWHALEPWPDVVSSLARLHERYALATLSNGNVALQVDLVRHARMRFDMLFSAETFGHYKPDPETYLGAAALLGYAPAQTMLVAAHESDLRAAARCGLRTAYVHRPAEYGSLTAALPLPQGFDAAVHDLRELAEHPL